MNISSSWCMYWKNRHTNPPWFAMPFAHPYVGEGNNIQASLVAYMAFKLVRRTSVSFKKIVLIHWYSTYASLTFAVYSKYIYKQFLMQINNGAFFDIMKITHNSCSLNGIWCFRVVICWININFLAIVSEIMLSNFLLFNSWKMTWLPNPGTCPSWRHLPTSKKLPTGCCWSFLHWDLSVCSRKLICSSYCLHPPAQWWEQVLKLGRFVCTCRSVCLSVRDCFLVSTCLIFIKF